MAVNYLTDQSGKVTDVQLLIRDYIKLLERANELPEYVKDGIKRGQDQALKGLTKSYVEVKNILENRHSK